MGGEVEVGGRNEDGRNEDERRYGCSAVGSMRK